MTLSHWIALITFGCFAVLTRYGYGVAYWNVHPRPVHLWSKTLAQKQAEAYRYVYGITSENENSYKEWW